MLDMFIIEEIRKREEGPVEQPRVYIPEFDPDWRPSPEPVSTGSSDRGVTIIETGGG
jgi:hypothetical protein